LTVLTTMGRAGAGSGAESFRGGFFIRRQRMPREDPDRDSQTYTPTRPPTRKGTPFDSERLLVSDPCRTVEDAQAPFAGLVEHGFGRIELAGDSAGAGLALSLLSLVVPEAREGPRVRPAGAAVISLDRFLA